VLLLEPAPAENIGVTTITKQNTGKSNLQRAPVNVFTCDFFQCRCLNEENKQINYLFQTKSSRIKKWLKWMALQLNKFGILK
jgi:hypothetical protein